MSQEAAESFGRLRQSTFGERKKTERTQVPARPFRPPGTAIPTLTRVCLVRKEAALTSSSELWSASHSAEGERVLKSRESADTTAFQRRDRLLCSVYKLLTLASVCTMPNRSRCRCLSRVISHLLSRSFQPMVTKSDWTSFVFKCSCCGRNKGVMSGSPERSLSADNRSRHLSVA